MSWLMLSRPNVCDKIGILIVLIVLMIVPRSVGRHGQGVMFSGDSEIKSETQIMGVHKDKSRSVMVP
jgi:hypothetical protein